METGKIKWFNGRKGYGFIKREANDDIFFHKKDIKFVGLRPLGEEDPVQFDAIDSPNGKKAVNIRRIQ